MSILIKGMEMPQNCDKCKFQSAFKLYCDAMPYNFCGNTDDIERPDWCPLTEIPTPHGRLVDLDKMIDRFWDGNSIEIFKSEFEQIQTVIEAEE